VAARILHAVRFNPVFYKSMKTILMKSVECRAVSAALRRAKVAGDQVEDTARSRHASRVTRHSLAFTIVELLTVIAIIAILAAMLLPVLSRAKIAAQKRQATVEISQIVGAIQQYDSVYGRFPVTANDQALAGTTNDFTCGGAGYDANGVNQLWILGYTNNAEVMAILMDITNTAVTSANMNHQKNPQQTIFLNAKMAADTNSPGVGPDLVYRDPWGNPYIITMDLNYDEQCHDLYYCRNLMSQTAHNSQTGFNGLFNPDVNGNSDNFLYHGKVMVWSAGPDRMVDTNSAANVGVNKDNILSWQ
jgi:type II secretory pathway pseudopilin PulG